MTFSTLVAFFTGLLALIGGWFMNNSNASVASVASSSTSTTSTSLPAGSPWLTTLPLGDLKYTTTAPKKGYIYLCNVMNGGQGAQEVGSWINTTSSTWIPSEKIHVEGSVSWPTATSSMKVVGSTRYLTSNDLPTDHPTGIFPIQSSDPAYKIDRNPNTITAQVLSFAFPAYPTVNKTPQCIYGQVGVMNDGVWLFDGFDNENRDAVAHEMQDSWSGHPDEGGVYHYHGFNTELKSWSISQVVGFALDGFPITGPKLPSGNYLATNDLDECHGITSTITLDGKQVTMYHYVLTEDFPYSVGCFRGTSTFRPTLSGTNANTNSGASNQNSNQSGTQSGTPPAPPQAAIDACSGKSSGASCSVGGNVTGTCATIGGSFACKPSS